MAELNKEQQELLTIIQYVNSQVRNGNVRKLINRFGRMGLTVEEIAQRTGFPVENVKSFLQARKIGTARIAEKWANDPVVTNVGSTITFDTTTLAGRVAKEVYEKYIAPTPSGSTVISGRAMMEEFDIPKNTSTEVFKILMAKDLVKRKNTSARQGYITT